MGGSGKASGTVQQDLQHSGSLETGEGVHERAQYYLWVSVLILGKSSFGPSVLDRGKVWDDRRHETPLQEESLKGSDTGLKERQLGG